VHDACSLAQAPLLIREQAWNEVVSLAEALARETSEAERELIARPELHRHLGLPRGARRALRRACGGSTRGAARLVRFSISITPMRAGGSRRPTRMCRAA